MARKSAGKNKNQNKKKKRLLDNLAVLVGTGTNKASGSASTMVGGKIARSIPMVGLQSASTSRKTKPMVVNSFTNARGRKGTRVTGCDIFGTADTSIAVGEVLFKKDLNPLEWLGTGIALEASLYEKWEVLKMEIVDEGFNAAIDGGGRKNFISYDVNNELALTGGLANLAVASGHDTNAQGKFWEEVVLQYDPKQHKSYDSANGLVLYTNTTTDSEPRTSIAGTFWSLVAANASASFINNYYINYDIVFYDRIVPTQASAPSFGALVVSSGPSGTTAAAPLGAVPRVTLNGIGATITAATSTINFPPQTGGEVYMIACHMDATTVTTPDVPLSAGLTIVDAPITYAHSSTAADSHTEMLIVVSNTSAPATVRIFSASATGTVFSWVYVARLQPLSGLTGWREKREAARMIREWEMINSMFGGMMANIPIPPKPIFLSDAIRNKKLLTAGPSATSGSGGSDTACSGCTPQAAQECTNPSCPWASTFCKPK